MEAVALCRKAGWGFVIFHRSGETEDTFMADFAVAMGGGQIKTGSLCRSERIAEYNRLLEIENELGKTALFENPMGKKRSYYYFGNLIASFLSFRRKTESIMNLAGCRIESGMTFLIFTCRCNSLNDRHS